MQFFLWILWHRLRRVCERHLSKSSTRSVRGWLGKDRSLNPIFFDRRDKADDDQPHLVLLLRASEDSKDFWRVETSVLEEAEKRTISYFSFHSSDCSRPVRNICIFGKGLFAFRRQMQMKGFLPDGRMQRNRGFALGWALLRILFIGNGSRSPLECVWCICLANNIQRFRSQIHSWFAAVIVLSIPLCFSLPAARGILSCNPFVTPCAILSTHENHRRMTRAKISRGGRSLMLKSLQDAGVSKVLRD